MLCKWHGVSGTQLGQTYRWVYEPTLECMSSLYLCIVFLREGNDWTVSNGRDIEYEKQTNIERTDSYIVEGRLLPTMAIDTVMA